jgi:transposase
MEHKLELIWFGELEESEDGIVDNYRWPSRKVSCPTCGAKTNSRCRGTDDKPRLANHMARIENARTYLEKTK